MVAVAAVVGVAVVIVVVAMVVVIVVAMVVVIGVQRIVRVVFAIATNHHHRRPALQRGLYITD